MTEFSLLSLLPPGPPGETERPRPRAKYAPRERSASPARRGEPGEDSPRSGALGRVTRVQQQARTWHLDDASTRAMLMLVDRLELVLGGSEWHESSEDHALPRTSLGEITLRWALSEDTLDLTALNHRVFESMAGTVAVVSWSLDVPCRVLSVRCFAQAPFPTDLARCYERDPRKIATKLDQELLVAETTVRARMPSSSAAAVHRVATCMVHAVLVAQQDQVLQAKPKGKVLQLRPPDTTRQTVVVSLQPLRRLLSEHVAALRARCDAVHFTVSFATQALELALRVD